MGRPSDIQRVQRALAKIVPSSEAAARRLQELAARDVEEAWGTLKKLTYMEEFPSVRLAAACAMLSYAAPPPTAPPEEAPSQQRSRPVDLSRYSVEELHAIKTLQNAQARIAREDEE